MRAAIFGPIPFALAIAFYKLLGRELRENGDRTLGAHARHAGEQKEGIKLLLGHKPEQLYAVLTYGKMGVKLCFAFAGERGIRALPDRNLLADAARVNHGKAWLEKGKCALEKVKHSCSFTFRGDFRCA